MATTDSNHDYKIYPDQTKDLVVQSRIKFGHPASCVFALQRAKSITKNRTAIRFQLKKLLLHLTGRSPKILQKNYVVLTEKRT